VTVSKLIILVTNNFVRVINKKVSVIWCLILMFMCLLVYPVGDLEFCFCIVLEDQNQILISLNILLKVGSHLCHFDLQPTALCFFFIHLV